MGADSDVIRRLTNEVFLAGDLSQAGTSWSATVSSTTTRCRAMPDDKKG